MVATFSSSSGAPAVMVGALWTIVLLLGTAAPAAEGLLVRTTTTTTTTTKSFSMVNHKKNVDLFANRVFFAPMLHGGASFVNHRRLAFHHCMSDSLAEEEEEEENDIIGRRIIVSGDVQGGYIRSCILNEAGRFRRLIGTMTPPDENSDTAEIYVEGKRNMVEGFIRWCEKGSKKVGLSQKLIVEKVMEEAPTGLYDGFYVRTGRDD